MKQTTKSLVTLLALVVAALAIGGVALWANKDEEKKAETKEHAAKVFDGLDKAKVKSVKLEKEGKLVALLVRDGGWKIAEPVQAEADDAAAGSLLDALAGLKQKSDVGGESDDKQYGLDAPRLRVTAKGDDGKESVLEVGADNPFDASVYLRKGGEKTVRVAAGTEKSAFDKSLFDLRDKRVSHLDEGAEITRLEVSGTPVAYKLEKDEAWKLVAPAAGSADASTAERVSNAVRGLRATGVAAEKADPVSMLKYGLAPAKITVRLGVKSGKDVLTRTLLLGQPPAQGGSVTVKTYAKREDDDTIWEVDGQIVKDLSQELEALQDKTLVKVQRESVRKVELAAPGGAKIEIARHQDAQPDGGTAEETFEVLAPQKGAAKRWKASAALNSLASLRAVKLGEAAPRDAKGLARLGLDRPRIATLLGDGDKVLAKVLIGADTPKEKRVYVLVEGAPRVAEVERGTIDDLPWKSADLLETPPPPEPATSLPDGGAAAAPVGSKP